MESNSKTWLMVRILFIVLSIPAWLTITAVMQDDFSAPPSWDFPLFFIGFSAFSVVALSVFRNDKEWVAPSWRGNPFDIGRPLEGFHLSGWSFVAGAVALLLASLLQEQGDWAWVFPGCIGVGLLAGVRLVSIPEQRRGA
ncbi:hypothetical protein QFW77_02740 [Luteimonas sp. RD2P54]|uniref:MFS transporter n=1 Tax=Luteimonas endophytica TaxID=3042023 RepID=A0ABT6J519_9GAMM|nr:hypothetical protein [Luteimonas endophytica]MDH5821912.1 hypothetical protein [Luteimonas endophytica]